MSEGVCLAHILYYLRQTRFSWDFYREFKENEGQEVQYTPIEMLDGYLCVEELDDDEDLVWLVVSDWYVLDFGFWSKQATNMD